jgi:lantibiotic modifying enzyme
MRTLSLNAHESSDGINWPAAAEGDAPFLMQWCHGAPGMVISFADAPFAAPELDRLLARAGELVWSAGPLAKGSNLCHGTAGNGYAFLKLYQRFGDPMWLDRARAFAMTAIEQCRAARGEYGQGRYSLWTGDPGVAVYLHDCLRAEARFPTIDIF